MKTSLTELIQTFENESKLDLWTKQERAIFKVCADIAKKKLPKERQQIEDAYNDGYLNDQLASEYFTEKFEQ